MEKRMNIRIDYGDQAFFTDNITISHGPNKFVIDFSQTTPRYDAVSGQMRQTLFVKHNTVLMDPRMAKIFLQTLQNNIKNYEKKFGKIEIPKRKRIKKAKTKTTRASTGSSKYIG